jgi:hypothetical protein
MVTEKQHKVSLFVIMERADWQTKCARRKVFVCLFRSFLQHLFRCFSAADIKRLQLEMWVETYIDCHAECLLLLSHSQQTAVISTQVHSMRCIIKIHLAVLDFVSCSQTDWNRQTSIFLTTRQKKCNLLSSVLETVNKSLYFHRDVI